MGIHPQEYLHLLEAILDCHFLSIYALLQGVEVFPLLVLLMHFFLQGDVLVEHFHLLMGDVMQPVHLSLYAEVSQPIQGSLCAGVKGIL